MKQTCDWRIAKRSSTQGGACVEVAVFEGGAQTA